MHWGDHSELVPLDLLSVSRLSLSFIFRTALAIIVYAFYQARNENLSSLSRSQVEIIRWEETSDTLLERTIKDARLEEIRVHRGITWGEVFDITKLLSR